MSTRRASALLDGGMPVIEANLACAYARAGLRDRAARVVERLRRGPLATRTSPMEFALASLGLGDKDRVIDALEEAHRTRAMRMLTVSAPFYSELVGESRYQVWLAQLRVPLRA
jgi:hypothetical protein